MTVSNQDITEAFNFRFATKVYKADEKIADEEFNLILESARLSPSSFGFEPWDIIVVQDMAIRSLLVVSASPVFAVITMK
jgi:nitroreductase